MLQHESSTAKNTATHVASIPFHHRQQLPQSSAAKKRFVLHNTHSLACCRCCTARFMVPFALKIPAHFSPLQTSVMAMFCPCSLTAQAFVYLHQQMAAHRFTRYRPKAIQLQHAVAILPTCSPGQPSKKRLTKNLQSNVTMYNAGGVILQSLSLCTNTELAFSDLSTTITRLCQHLKACDSLKAQWHPRHRAVRCLGAPRKWITQYFPTHPSFAVFSRQLGEASAPPTRDSAHKWWRAAQRRAVHHACTHHLPTAWLSATNATLCRRTSIVPSCSCQLLNVHPCQLKSS
jgi:hypothetical protein